MLIIQHSLLGIYMDSKIQIPLSNIKWLLPTAKYNNVDSSKLLSILDVLPEQFNDPLLTVSLDNVITVRDIVRNKNPNPAFALIAGRNIPMGDFGVLDYICSSSPTVYTSFTKLQHYFGISHHPSSNFKFSVIDNHVCLELIMDSAISRHIKWYVQETIEFTFSYILNRLRAKTGKHIVPTKLCFLHSKPEYIDEYYRTFQSDIVFDAPQNLMYFDSEILELKQIKTEDSKLHKLVSTMAESALQKLPNISDIENKVIQILKKEIQNGKPRINLISDKLFISRQTLHRKLADSGTTYTNLIDNYRKNLAQMYLQESSITIDEISLLLGYSNTSAFHRSFKRLTGISPNTYRKKKYILRISDKACILHSPD